MFVCSLCLVSNKLFLEFCICSQRHDNHSWKLCPSSKAPKSVPENQPWWIQYLRFVCVFHVLVGQRGNLVLLRVLGISFQINCFNNQLLFVAQFWAKQERRKSFPDIFETNIILSDQLCYVLYRNIVFWKFHQKHDITQREKFNLNFTTRPRPTASKSDETRTSMGKTATSRMKNVNKASRACLWVNLETYPPTCWRVRLEKLFYVCFGNWISCLLTIFHRPRRASCGSRETRARGRRPGVQRAAAVPCRKCIIQHWNAAAIAAFDTWD